MFGISSPLDLTYFCCMYLDPIKGSIQKLFDHLSLCEQVSSGKGPIDSPVYRISSFPLLPILRMVQSIKKSK